MDETRARALLAAAAVAPPDGRVDVDLARRRGRRQLRRRRAGLAGAAALATAAVIVVPIRVLGSGGAATRGGQVASPRPGATVAPPRQFNPLIPYVAFGWLPAGLSPAGGMIAAAEANITAGDHSEWTAHVFAAGRCRRSGARLECVLDSATRMNFQLARAAPRVDGHRAYWCGPGKALLVWQYARDSWAALSAAAHVPVRETLKVASTLRYHVATRPSIRFPVQLTRMSPAWHVIGMYFRYDAGVRRASQYQLAGGRGAPSITTDPATRDGGCFSPRGQSVQKTINGYRVTITHYPAASGRPAEQQLCAAHADGLSLFYSTFGGHASPGAAALFAQHTRLLGTNPAAWTTQPLS
jgi:hypothetical protein